MMVLTLSTKQIDGKFTLYWKKRIINEKLV